MPTTTSTHRATSITTAKWCLAHARSERSTAARAQWQASAARHRRAADRDASGYQRHPLNADDANPLS